MICDDVCQLILDDVFLRLTGFGQDLDVLLKIEGFNGAGSIKLKTALGLVDDLERRGRLYSGMGIVESSSGILTPQPVPPRHWLPPGPSPPGGRCWQPSQHR